MVVQSLHVCWTNLMETTTLEKGTARTIVTDAGHVSYLSSYSVWPNGAGYLLLLALCFLWLSFLSNLDSYLNFCFFFFGHRGFSLSSNDAC
jgi:hypothetical protein